MSVIVGECIEVMRQMPDHSVDVVITDPPYGIGFMGHEWDQPGDYAAVTANGTPGAPFSGEQYPANHRAGVRVQVPPGQRRNAQPPPSGNSRDGKAMNAGRYDLSLTANQRFQAWCEAWGRECLRVLKPGGHLLSFGSTRTSHRLVAGLEDAGFEIRDTLVWLFGSGFPKSRDVGAAIDRALGAERTEAIGPKRGHEDFIERTDRHGAGSSKEGWARPWQEDPDAVRRYHTQFAPATPEGAEWDGWGTALKPGHEPIVLARAPFAKRALADNILAGGLGALNVTETAIPIGDLAAYERNCSGERGFNGTRDLEERGATDLRMGGAAPAAGRWPANVLLGHHPDCELVGTKRVKGISGGTGNHDGSVYGARSNQGAPVRDYADADGMEVVEDWRCVVDCPIAMLDGQAPDVGAVSPVTGLEPSAATGNVYGAMARTAGVFHDDHGGASRFFYCAKASRTERNAGLAGFPLGELLWSSGEQNPGSFQSPGTERRVANHHPTVKPIDLMRWLVKLACPPGGHVLDPFCGSGTTGCAAVVEGAQFTGIERSDEYAEIAEARIRWWADKPGHLSTAAILRETAPARDHEQRGQMTLEVS
jgi:site-specific DNA-methyltransferase (adenine-specific)